MVWIKLKTLPNLSGGGDNDDETLAVDEREKEQENGRVREYGIARK